MRSIDCVVVELFFLASSSLPIVLGYWKYKCWSNIVQFSWCDLRFTQSSVSDVTSMRLVFRVDLIVVLIAFLDDFVFFFMLGSFIYNAMIFHHISIILKTSFNRIKQHKSYL